MSDDVCSREQLVEKLNRLANYILANTDWEPSRSECAVDCAIRVMGSQWKDIADLRRQVSTLFMENVEDRKESCVKDEKLRGIGRQFKGAECHDQKVVDGLISSILVSAPGIEESVWIPHHEVLHDASEVHREGDKGVLVISYFFAEKLFL